METVLIQNNEYTYTVQVKEKDEIKKSFNELANKTFGLTFNDWKDTYIPHVLLDGEQVVSNISVNIIDIKWQGQMRHYIQLGTVMTDPNYRKKGLSRWLMEKILQKYNGSDAIYLFANDSVLDFYPKFGFEKAKEYHCQKAIVKTEGRIKKLDVNIAEDKEKLLNAYKLSNPFSTFAIENNEGLLLFYCEGPMRDNIYLVEEYGAVVVAEYKEESLFCYDIFCENNGKLEDILSIMVLDNTKNVALGFFPINIKGFDILELKEEDTTLFVLNSKENLLANHKLMFPLLSHA